VSATADCRVPPSGFSGTYVVVSSDAECQQTVKISGVNIPFTTAVATRTTSAGSAKTPYQWVKYQCISTSTINFATALCCQQN
jgi:hypothetical protein